MLLVFVLGRLRHGVAIARNGADFERKGHFCCFALLLSLGAFAAFALSLLHLVNRNMQNLAEATSKRGRNQSEGQEERQQENKSEISEYQEP